VYAATYARDGAGIARIGEPRALTAARLALVLRAMVAAGELTGPFQVIGDGAEAYADVLRGCLDVGVAIGSSAGSPPHAAMIAQLGAARLAHDPAGDDLVRLASAYLRPPEAELNQSVVAPSTGLHVAPPVRHYL
jgi:hypothetical protein